MASSCIVDSVCEMCRDSSLLVIVSLAASVLVALSTFYSSIDFSGDINSLLHSTSASNFNYMCWLDLIYHLTRTH